MESSMIGVDIEAHYDMRISHNVCNDGETCTGHAATNRLGKLLPDDLAQIQCFDFLTDAEKLFINQLQGRTYANLFAFFAKFINRDVLISNRKHWLDGPATRNLKMSFDGQKSDQGKPFRNIGFIVGGMMPAGYEFAPAAGDLENVVSKKTAWAVWALTLKFELITQRHFAVGNECPKCVSSLFEDAIAKCRPIECLHAVVSEMEWIIHDTELTPRERDKSVEGLVELIGVIDRILQSQARADTRYFAMNSDRPVGVAALRDIEAGLLKAYRWQFLVSGMQHQRFAEVLDSLTTDSQTAQIRHAQTGLVDKVGRRPVNPFWAASTN